MHQIKMLNGNAFSYASAEVKGALKLRYLPGLRVFAAWRLDDHRGARQVVTFIDKAAL